MKRDGTVTIAGGTCLLAVLATCLYAPALFAGRTLAHGDMSSLDAALFEYLPRILKGEKSALWIPGIFGGHPFFAEGQAGLTNPLTLLWAVVVTPFVGSTYSRDLFYWVLTISSGVGVMGLARSLGASVWASTFAALALVFSPIWQQQQYAISLRHALAWAPWSLWAFEHWLKRPTWNATALLGGSWALVLMSGHPQTLHATVLYPLVTLLVVPFQADPRSEWMATWRSRVPLALGAVAIGVGLAAVQLLPLLELTNQSHRAGGTPLIFTGLMSAWGYARGFLFTAHTVEPPSYYPGVGSILVTTLACAQLLLPVPARVRGHLVAVVALVSLGMEQASPVFGFIHRHDLLPGLHFFRQSWVYLPIAAIGVSVLAGFAIDAIAGMRSDGLPRARVRRWVPAGLIVALVVEIAVLRLQPFNFFDPSVLAKPPEVEVIKSNPDWREFKTLTFGRARLVTFNSPLAPDLEARIRKAVASLPSMTGLLWDLPAVDGPLALELLRRRAINLRLYNEVLGFVPTPPGRRLIDLLSVRYITHDAPLSTAGFRQLLVDDRPEIQTHENRQQVLHENTAAFPRFQFYTRAKIVNSFDEALAALVNTHERTLVIEDADPQRHVESVGSTQQASTPPRYDLLEASDTTYRLAVTTTYPVWLFLADANYPGWSAAIDDQPVDVFTAQILGKAVRVPAGVHQVSLSYVSNSFRIGFLISICTVAALIVTVGARWRKHSP